MAKVQTLGGLDDDQMINDEAPEEAKASTEKSRRAFFYWNVSGRDYRLKLNADMICRLEDKYKGSLFKLMDDMPPLSVMLTIIQAAMKPWEHGIGYEAVKQLYDAWIGEGNSQLDLFRAVLIPTMVVSGFFPEETAQKLLAEMEEAQ